LQELSKSLQEHAISRKASNYNTADSLECDVWFDATQVWEVKAADLSVSSVHKGALGRVSGAERGIGLRFPRFERIRDDKKPQQATTSDQILELYYNQDSIVDNVGDEDEDGI
jgi:DNA ligase-1